MSVNDELKSLVIKRNSIIGGKMDKKEKIKKKEEDKKKLKESNKNKDEKSKEVFNWNDNVVKGFLNLHKDTFSKSMDSFEPASIGGRISLYNYHHSPVLKLFHIGEFNKRIYSKASKELMDIPKKLVSIISESVKENFGNEGVNILNKIAFDNKLSIESLTKLIGSKSIQFNKDYMKDLISETNPKMKYSSWILKIKNFTDIQKDILGASEMGSISFEDLHTRALEFIPNLSLGLGRKFKEYFNKKLKFYKCVESRDENGALVISLESLFGVYSGKTSLEDATNTSTYGFFSKKINDFSWEDLGDDFIKTAVENDGKEIEVDLSKPYMALSAIFGLSFRNPKENRIVYPSNSIDSLFSLVVIPEKNEMQKKFFFKYSAKFAFDFIERVRNNVNLIDQRDLLMLSYEFGRVLAYYTFLLTFNRTKFAAINGLLEEVKSVIITLAELIIRCEEDGKFKDLFASNDSREIEMSKIENGEYGIPFKLSSNFIQNLDSLDAYTDGNYNDVPFKDILNLSYVALNYIILGVIPTSLSKRNDITLNQFLIACNSDLIKEYIYKLTDGEETLYENRALYGLIYTYYRLRDFYGKNSPFVTIVNNVKNSDIFFSSIYKIGALLESEASKDTNNANKPYLVEILENSNFGSNMRLSDLLNTEQVFNPADDVTKLDSTNVPMLLTAGLTDWIDSFDFDEKVEFNPIAKMLDFAASGGVIDSFDAASIELYVLEYLSNVDCHIVSPYRIYKIAMLGSLARFLHKGALDTKTNDNELITSLSNIIVICDSLIFKLYNEWFDTRSSIYHFEERIMDYPAKDYRMNKHKYLKKEIDMILIVYNHFILKYQNNLGSFTTMKNVDLQIKFKRYSENSLDFIIDSSNLHPDRDLYKDYENYLNFSLPVFSSIFQSDLYRNNSIIMECLYRINSQPEMFNKIKSLLTDALPIPQTSSKSEVIDSMYKDTSYPSPIFSKVLHNVSTILNRTDLTPEARFYLTFCLMYASIIRNHINNVLIKPNSNILTIDNKDDLVELGTQTSNSIESYMLRISRKTEEESKKKRIVEGLF